MSRKKFLKALEIPEEVATDTVRLTLSGFKKLRVDNYRSLVEYESERIRINTADKLICIEGSGFNITSVTDDFAEIEGEISNISFE